MLTRMDAAERMEKILGGSQSGGRLKPSGGQLAVKMSAVESFSDSGDSEAIEESTACKWS